MINKRQVARWLKYWQRRLRLQDWRIRLEIVKTEPKDTWQARVLMRRWDKCAHIQVAKEPSKHDDPTELALIHELVHLHMNSFEPPKPSKEGYDAMEAAIDCIAWGLFKTKYPRWKDKWSKQ